MHNCFISDVSIGRIISDMKREADAINKGIYRDFIKMKCSNKKQHLTKKSFGVLHHSRNIPNFKSRRGA